MTRSDTPLTPARVAGGLRLALLAGLLGATTLPTRAAAQDRLVGLRVFTAGATFESVTFEGDGLLQTPLPGQDALTIRSVSQFAVPIAAAYPIGNAWTFDVSGIYSSGEVTVGAVGTDAPGTESTVSLQGVSDVRARLSGRLLNDGVIVTLGVNAPTGQTQLDAGQLTALRTLAAPGLSLTSPPVGTGASGTVGLLLARQLGEWGVAVGGAYEYRGTFQPVAAFVPNAPATDFSPGGVVRLTAGLDGFVGKHRLTLTASSDVFLEDELRNTSVASATGDDALARVQLGPQLGLDAQLQVAAPRLRALVLWTSVRARSAFARDGITVDGSGATYLDGGIRLGVPLAAKTDLFATLDGRWHSGLEIDEGLPTAGVTSVGGTLGFSQRLGNGGVALQPFVRGQVGTVTAGGTGADRPEAGITGFGAGVVLVTRF